MTQYEKWREWAVERLTKMRERYEREMALDDQAIELSDEQAALLVDVCRELGLTVFQMYRVLGDAAVPYIDWPESVMVLDAIVADAC